MIEIRTRSMGDDGHWDMTRRADGSLVLWAREHMLTAEALCDLQILLARQRIIDGDAAEMR